MKMPLPLGTINDGAEPQFPTSDVPLLLPLALGVMGQELTRPLKDQVPASSLAVQGDDTTDPSVGIVLTPPLTAVGVDIHPLSTWQKHPQNWLVAVRAEYHGTPLVLMSCKRPGAAHADTWPEWNANLAAVVRSEMGFSPYVIVGLDANAAAPTDLTAATRLRWQAARGQSMVGFLTSVKVEVLATTALPTTGEHPPVLTLVRIPVTDAP